MELCVLGLCIAFVVALRLPGLCVGRNRKTRNRASKHVENTLPQTFKNEAPGGSKMQAKMQSKIAPKWLPGGSKIAPKWLPEGSRGPAESRSSFLMPVWRPLGRSWALLGRSWGGLGTSWAAPGPSWAAPGGHFGLLAVTFSSFLGGIFGGLARGLQKSCFWMVVWLFL